MKKLATNERGFIFIVAIGLNPLDLLTIKKLYIDLAASVKKTFILFYIVKSNGPNNKVMMYKLCTFQS